MTSFGRSRFKARPSRRVRVDENKFNYLLRDIYLASETNGSRPDWLADIGDAAKTGGPAIDLHIHDTHYIGLIAGVRAPEKAEVQPDLMASARPAGG